MKFVTRIALFGASLFTFFVIWMYSTMEIQSENNSQKAITFKSERTVVVLTRFPDNVPRSNNVFRTDITTNLFQTYVTVLTKENSLTRNSAADVDDASVNKLVVNKEAKDKTGIRTSVKGDKARAKTSNVEYLKLDNGLGKNGDPVIISESSLSSSDRSKVKALYKEHGFNAYVSDLVSLNRKLHPPVPLRCKDLRYPPGLPQVSIIIPFRDEVLSVLLRTVYSILGNTPDRLLKELILVDDGSTKDDLKHPLDKYIEGQKKISIIRLPVSEGLMMARQNGIDSATSEYFAVFDAHMEVTEGWLEPLLARLLENPKALVCSRIGVIDKHNFKVWWPKEDKVAYFPFFTWYLEQEWAFYRREFLDTITNVSQPVPFGTIQGMMIVMKKSWFLQLGGFDPGMKLWGTEQIELSVKVWTCGGVVEMIPCSYAAHLYRNVIWKFEKQEGRINKVRFAEVWMDEYKEYLYTFEKIDKIEFGNIEDRKRIRRENNCASFQNYVYNMQKFGFIYDPKKVFFRGFLCNNRYRKCLLYDYKKQLLTIQGVHAAQKFELSQELRLHILMHSNCFVYNSKNKMVLQLLGATKDTVQSKWNYIVNETMVHKPTGKCLTASKDGNVSLEACSLDKSQFWFWD